MIFGRPINRTACSAVLLAAWIGTAATAAEPIRGVRTQLEVISRDLLIGFAPNDNETIAVSHLDRTPPQPSGTQSKEAAGDAQAIGRLEVLGRGGQVAASREFPGSLVGGLTFDGEQLLAVRKDMGTGRITLNTFDASLQVSRVTELDQGYSAQLLQSPEIPVPYLALYEGAPPPSIVPRVRLFVRDGNEWNEVLDYQGERVPYAIADTWMAGSRVLALATRRGFVGATTPSFVKVLTVANGTPEYSDEYKLPFFVNTLSETNQGTWIAASVGKLVLVGAEFETLETWSIDELGIECLRSKMLQLAYQPGRLAAGCMGQISVFRWNGNRRRPDLIEQHAVDAAGGLVFLQWRNDGARLRVGLSQPEVRKMTNSGGFAETEP